MHNLDKEILDNHKTYTERKALYKSFGYDVDEERDFILKKAQPVSGRILEAGTGKGHFALSLARAGYSFVTFDISPEEQRFAKLNIAHFGFQKQVDFRIEDGEKTSFAGESFDVIFSVNVLHHLHNPYRVIDELARLTAPCGKIILADFTDKGFDVMEKIHGLEGSIHEVSEVGLPEAENYILKKSFLVKKASSAYQSVIVAQKISAGS